MLRVNRIGLDEEYPGMAEVSAILDSLGEGHSIGNVNWETFPYKPDVRFNIAYNDTEIFIKYYVREKRVKAEKTLDNQMVCEDSCVEFFVSPSDDGIYYNFEFNPTGVCLLGSGHDRDSSSLADKSVIADIRRLSSFGREPFAEKEINNEWTLTVAIPLSAFFRHSIKSPDGLKFKANFYKCGDLLSVPHYLTWEKVGTENPDFHRPEFFGELVFD